MKIASRLTKGTGLVILVVAGILIVARMVAPSIIQGQINKRLARIPDYTGSVGDIDLGLWRGAYVIHEIDIRKRVSSGDKPIFAAQKIDFSIAWRDLFRGRIVSDILLSAPSVTLILAPVEELSQVEADRRWQDVVQDLFPIEIQHLEIEEGTFEFIDQRNDQQVDLVVDQITCTATGLQNRRRGSGDTLPAQVDASGATIGGGFLRVSASLAPLEPQPYFDIDCSLERVDLPAWNDLLRRYANVDLSAGTLELYMEVAARDGKFEGYVKPFFEDLDFENITDRERGLMARIWESMVAGFNSLVKDQSKDQLGTRVPFNGSYEGTNIGVLTAIGNAFRNGFVSAFSEAIEGEIRPSDIATEPE